MPWLETAPVDQRIRFIQDALSDRFIRSELCARYGVSRRVGYQWLARYEAEGRRGLHDRSRAPHHCPHRIHPDVAELLCALRRERPLWGARRLLRISRDATSRRDGLAGPGTTADLLARRGLVQRRRRRPHQHPGVVPPTTTAPNDLWTADFKGRVRTGNGVYCFSLTIADQHTRSLLASQGLLSTQPVTARPGFERVFREDGLPRAIRTDKWGDVCHPGGPRSVVPQCVVDPAQDSGSADPPGPAAREWRP